MVLVSVIVSSRRMAGGKEKSNKQVTGEAKPGLSVFKRSFLGTKPHTLDLVTG